MMTVISLGAGVQSTTMALMAAHGEFTPMPDCAIFADTGWEPKAVYEHLKWLMSDNVLPFPVHVVSGGNLKQDQAERSRSWHKHVPSVPWYLADSGQPKMGLRGCTREYKIYPIRRQIRRLLGGKPTKNSVDLWIGISLDEVVRMKPSQVQYINNRWPLIERRFSRWDCLLWLERKGYSQPPKSACIGCPFHDDAAWRRLRDQSPEEWAEAISLDKAIRNQEGFSNQQFMHRSLVPLDEVDLTTAEDHGQLNLFNNECEGMCGV